MDPTVNMLSGGIPTESPRQRAAIERAETIAKNCDEPVLFLGPSGTGKSEMGRRFGEAKRAVGRITGEVVYFDCTELKEDTHLTALTGFVAGAYTGAIGAREGLLARAHNGVLILDEVGELDLKQQAQLLRIIETKRYRPLGSDEERTTNACIVFATHRNLRAMVRAGLFRFDLLARFDTFPVHMVPLCERKEDIPATVDFYVELSAKTRGMTVIMTPPARVKYLAGVTGPSATWPDNFRGLLKSVKRMAVFAIDARIDVADVDRELAFLRQEWADAASDDGLDGLADPVKLAELEPLDRVTIAEVVRVCRRSATMTDAARELFGPSERPDHQRVRRMLEKVGLTFDGLHGRA